MATKVDFEWEGKSTPITLRANVSGIDARMRKSITGRFATAEGRAVTYAKTNAPWTDDTAAARNGLGAVAITNQYHWELVVFHSVYYGLYLEVCNSGKYAIIMPTVKHVGEQLMRSCERLLEKTAKTGVPIT